jgi:hypothetical protein
LAIGNAACTDLDQGGSVSATLVDAVSVGLSAYSGGAMISAAENLWPAHVGIGP